MPISHVHIPILSCVPFWASPTHLLPITSSTSPSPSPSHTGGTNKEHFRSDPITLPSSTHAHTGLDENLVSRCIHPIYHNLAERRVPETPLSTSTPESRVRTHARHRMLFFLPSFHRCLCIYDCPSLVHFVWSLSNPQFLSVFRFSDFTHFEYAPSSINHNEHTTNTSHHTQLTNTEHCFSPSPRHWPFLRRGGFSYTFLVGNSYHSPMLSSFLSLPLLRCCCCCACVCCVLCCALLPLLSSRSRCSHCLLNGRNKAKRTDAKKKGTQNERTQGEPTNRQEEKANRATHTRTHDKHTGAVHIPSDGLCTLFQRESQQHTIVGAPRSASRRIGVVGLHPSHTSKFRTPTTHAHTHPSPLTLSVLLLSLPVCS